MAPNAHAETADRVVERRRGVALARHYREAEGLSIAQIADCLGRSPATIKAYFYDPTGEKARAVKARYQGVCRGCGAYTQPRNGKGDAYAYCKACHPGAIGRRWTRERVLDAMRAWQARPHGGVRADDADAALLPSGVRIESTEAPQRRKWPCASHQVATDTPHVAVPARGTPDPRCFTSRT
jgi:AraC-like DNA-binding protein